MTDNHQTPPPYTTDENGEWPTVIFYGGGNGITSNRSDVLRGMSQRSNISGVDSLIFGPSGLASMWGTGRNQAPTLTYSFSSSNSKYDHPIVPTSLNDKQINLARQVMQFYSNVSNLKFAEVSDTSQSAGDIRWAATTDPVVSTAMGNPPEESAGAGDIWLGKNHITTYTNPTPGTYAYQCYLHELGHALGLGHPHQSDTKPSFEEDQIKYSVMSYRDYPGDAPGAYFTSYFPTTLMLNDIAAIQYLYGVNTAYQAGNNTYSWAAGTSIFETIYDAGGIDAIDASNQTQSVLLNLNSGSWSQIGKEFWNSYAYFRDCLTIAYNTVIENATGSSYNDTLIGNSVANTLNGGLGADTMQGQSGDDTYYVENIGDNVIENFGEGNDSIYSSINFTLSDNVENLTLSGSATHGTGNSLNNLITGNSGHNSLYGGLGADTMRGLEGNDTYYVDNAGDIVIENTNEGLDYVFSGIDYTLGDNIETLVLLNTTAIRATGNTLSNEINGNSNNNILDGKGGADILKGWAGNDTYYVENSGDLVIESINEGIDTVNSSINYILAANVENLVLNGSNTINGTGNELSNLITGNSSANVLDGGEGADTLKGLAGDDTYYIDNDGDTVLENKDEGIDTVISSITYTLSDHIEKLTLAGNASINGTGNNLNNTILGNNYNNTISGGMGNDTLQGFGGRDILYGEQGNDTLCGDQGGDLLYGGVGNDRYLIFDESASTIEYNNEGTDSIVICSDSILNHKLSENVENFISPSLGNAITITGNDLSNLIQIGNGNNTITGGKGDDTIEGGGGSDTYLFNRGDGADIIRETGKEYSLSKSDIDTLKFGQNINSDQLWFSKQDLNGALIVSVIGTTDKISIENWYTNQQISKSEAYIERFLASDGKTLTNDKVDQLVNAMAAFSIPALGQTALPTSQLQALIPTIAAAWS